jgi:hypothetical protein
VTLLTTSKAHGVSPTGVRANDGDTGVQRCIAVLNAGSSSINYKAGDEGAPLFRGQVENIGLSPHLKVADTAGTVVAKRRRTGGALDHHGAIAGIMKIGRELLAARRISHAYIMDIANRPDLLIVPDAAINIFPTVEDKREICQNAIGLAQAVGFKEPKVAVLSAVETVNPRLLSTIDAAALCKMADRGQITGGLVDGPLAFDNAVSEGAAVAVLLAHARRQGSPAALGAE